MKHIVVSLREKNLPGGIILVPVASVTLALGAAALLLLASGVDPIKALTEMIMGAFGDSWALTDTLVKTIPLLLCGLGVAVAFTMNLWNIGAEGQFAAGTIAATWIPLTFPGLPSPIMILAMILAGMFGGAIWALGPAMLKAKLQVNEIITTLMMNYIGYALVEYFLIGPWKDPVSHGFPMSAQFVEAAHLPTWGSTNIHLGLAFGLIALVGVWLLLGKTSLGFSMRVIGHSREAANLSGMPIAKVIIITLCLSGALAGLAGMSELAGIQHRLRPNISPGYGYTAIIVAWLARLNPVAMLMVSFLIGGLFVGGEVLQMSMKLPSAVSLVIQGMILFFVLAGEFLARYKIRLTSVEKDKVVGNG